MASLNSVNSTELLGWAETQVRDLYGNQVDRDQLLRDLNDSSYLSFSGYSKSFFSNLNLSPQQINSDQASSFLKDWTQRELSPGLRLQLSLLPIGREFNGGGFLELKDLEPGVHFLNCEKGTTTELFWEASAQGSQVLLIRVEDDAHLSFSVLRDQFESDLFQSEGSLRPKKSKDSIQTGASLGILQGAESTVEGLFFTSSLTETMDEVFVEQVGEKAKSDVYGVQLGQPGAEQGLRFKMVHRSPQGESRQLVKSVLSPYSKSFFNGIIRIGAEAQKVESSQLNQNLLIGSGGLARSIPELEVEADDVKAGHGSSTGQLQDDGLFYLMSRGLSESSAIELLSLAFIEDVFLKMNCEKLREVSRSRSVQTVQNFAQLVGKGYEKSQWS